LVIPGIDAVYGERVALGRLDLNLLVTLDALLQERNVTRAAARIGVTQPTVSAALARLRRHFGDPLLIRVGNRYELTPLAAQLRRQTGIALDGVERVFAAQPGFDPAGSDREFTVMTSDYGVAVAGRALAAAFAREAPGMRLRMEHITDDGVDHAEETLRGIDGLLLPRGFVSDLPHLDLYSDRWVCVVDAANTRVGDALTMTDLAELPWVVTFNRPTAYTPAMLQLRLLGVEAQVQVVLDTFLAIPYFVAGTDRIALIQERLAQTVATPAGLRILECPFEVVPLIESLYWHPVYTRDPSHTWIRERLSTACEEVYGPI